MSEEYDLGDSVILEVHSNQHEPTAKEVLDALLPEATPSESPWERRFDNLLYDKMRYVTKALPSYEERIRLHRAYEFMRQEYANMIQRHGIEALHGIVMSVGYGKGEDSPSALYSKSAMEYCKGLLDKDMFEGPVFSVFFRAKNDCEGKRWDYSFATVAKISEHARIALERMIE